MILLHIISPSYKQLNEVAEFLVNKRLIIDALVQGCMGFRLHEAKGKVESQQVNLLVGKTKALLFDTIEQTLRSRYGDDMPEIYSVPIVNMNWEKSRELADNTIKISSN